MDSKQPSKKPSKPPSAIDLNLARREKELKEKILREQEGKTTVLVVDDYLQARQMYENFLSGKGYRVVTAANAEEALISFSASKVNLVILDYNLPDMNGIRLLGKIREKDGNVPVIMVTANDGEDVVKGAIQGGISSYLLKPVKHDLFMERVEKALASTTQDSKELPPLG